MLKDIIKTIPGFTTLVNFIANTDETIPKQTTTSPPDSDKTWSMTSYPPTSEACGCEILDCLGKLRRTKNLDWIQDALLAESYYETYSIKTEKDRYKRERDAMKANGFIQVKAPTKGRHLMVRLTKKGRERLKINQEDKKRETTQEKDSLFEQTKEDKGVEYEEGIQHTEQHSNTNTTTTSVPESSYNEGTGGPFLYESMYNEGAGTVCGLIQKAPHAPLLTTQADPETGATAEHPRSPSSRTISHSPRVVPPTPPSSVPLAQHFPISPSKPQQLQPRERQAFDSTVSELHPKNSSSKELEETPEEQSVDECIELFRILGIEPFDFSYTCSAASKLHGFLKVPSIHPLVAFIFGG